MSRKKKSIITVLLVLALVLFVLFALACLYGMIKYVNNVPKLTPKQEVFEVWRGESYPLSDFVDVECEGEYFLAVQYVDLEGFVTANCSMKDACQFLHIGNEIGTYRVKIVGVGCRSERGDPVEITVVVKKI